MASNTELIVKCWCKNWNGMYFLVFFFYSNSLL